MAFCGYLVKEFLFFKVLTGILTKIEAYPSKYYRIFQVIQARACADMLRVARCVAIFAWLTLKKQTFRMLIVKFLPVFKVMI